MQPSELDQEAPEKNQAGIKEVLWCAESEEPHLTGVEEVSPTATLLLRMGTQDRAGSSSRVFLRQGPPSLWGWVREPPGPFPAGQRLLFHPWVSAHDLNKPRDKVGFVTLVLKNVEVY